MKIIPNFIKLEKFEDTKVETRSHKQQNHMTNFFIHPLGALDSQPQVIKFTSCLPMVGGSLRLPPPLKLVAML